jgi:murein DD-endopeptidase MepM/ murein hydrolase activator NlpD
MRISKKVISALLSLSLLAMPAISSLSVSAESISSLKQQLEELEQKNQEYQDILDQTQEDIDEQEAYNEALVNKISVLDDKIALAHQSIDDLNSEINEKQAAIDEANAEIADQMDTLCQRLRTIYMAGNASDLEIIFGAKDFSDFIDKMQLVKTLSNYDKDLIASINEKLDEIAEQKADLEADKTDLEAQEASLEADQADLNTLLEENEETLKNLYASNADAKSSLESAALESEEVENAIKAYYAAQEQAAASSNNSSSQSSTSQSSSSSSSSESSSNSSNSSSSESNSSSTVETETTPSISSSGYTWPCPGYYYLSSEWNEDRGSYNHGAIDIAGSGIMGASVVAAASGTVIATNSSCSHNWGKSGSCGCGGGYGNYIIIDHGNGKSTLYAHLTSLNVSTGQSVSQGQTIGYVGSTGYSTGPHLHFECRLNNVKYNPMTEF